MRGFISRLFALLLIGIVSFSNNVSSEEVKNTMYFFWGDGCQHCAKARFLVDDIEVRYPHLKVIRIETWKNRDGSLFYQQIAKSYGVDARGVPAFFIGKNPPIFGFSENAQYLIAAQVDNCIYPDCINPNQAASDTKVKTVESNPAKPCDDKDADMCLPDENDKIDISNLSLSDLFSPSKALAATASKNIQDKPLNTEKTIIKVPFIGEVDVCSGSLLVSTLVIAFVDGVNPCSLWLIMFLLGIVIHSGSRAKILLVSTIFLGVTAFVYGLFMLGMLNVFLYVGYVKWIQVAIGVLALIFAIVNIKDYFWFKQGISFTISDEKKPGIFKDIRNIMKKDNSIWAIIIGTVSLSLGVALVEFPCTAGFPVIWTNLMAQHNVHGGQFAGLFALYLIIYLLDELVVIMTAVITLNMGKFEEKHGRMLKLLGGAIMLALALAMLFAPDKLKDLKGTLIIFGLSIGISGLIILIHRFLLPKLGIKIGSEKL